MGSGMAGGFKPRGGAEPSPDERRQLGDLLLEAAGDGDADRIRHLAKLGADAGHRGEGSGRDALSFAAGAGSLAAVEALLALGARARGRDKLGRTALIRAALAGSAACVEALIHRSEINAQDQDGLDALMAAAAAGSGPCARLLLAEGADPGRTDAAGQRALSHGLESQSMEVLEALLPVSDPWALDPRRWEDGWWTLEAREAVEAEKARRARLEADGLLEAMGAAPAGGPGGEPGGEGPGPSRAPRL